MIAKSKTRSANFELLRICCMLLIVLSHAISCGGIAAVTAGAGLSLNYVLIWIIRAVCRVSVPCFVLINGYFMCKQEFHLKRIVLLWASVFFYSAGIYFILCLLGIETFSAYNTVVYLLPFMTQRYWFVSSYMMLLVWTPILNRAIAAMNQKQHFLLVIGLGVLYGPLANVMGWAFDFTRAADGYGYTWFLFLYLVAAYLRLYLPKARKNYLYLLGFAILTLLIAAITMFLEQMEEYIPASIYQPYMFYNLNSIFVLLSAICVFQFFRSLNIREGRAAEFFRRIGGLTFGVYLIHEHQSLRVFLWNNLLHVSRNGLSLTLFPHMCICVLGVFAVCLCIEWARKALFSILHIQSGLTRLSDSVERKACVALSKRFDKPDSS